MSVAEREMKREVMAVLHASGCHIISEGHDGAGHRTVTFEHHAQRKTFHYPSTGRANGHTRRNTASRLKRVIREIPPAPPKPATLTHRPQVAAPPVSPLPHPRLTATRRREIAKRYLELRSIEKLVDETGVPLHKLHILLNAAGGEPQRIYRRDLNKQRSEMARQRRAPETPIVLKKAAAAALTAPQFAKTRLRGVAAMKRNIEIAKLVYQKKMSPEVVAHQFGMNVAYVAKIAQNHFPLIGKKVS